MNMLTFFLITLRCFALLSGLIGMAFILLGPGICYIDTESNDITICDSQVNFNFLQWNKVSKTVYLHVLVILTTLSALAPPIYSLIYLSITNEWEEKNKQILKLFKASMIFLLSGFLEVYLLITIDVQISVEDSYGIKSFVQGWASAAGIYFSISILQLIDMFIIYLKADNEKMKEEVI
uniref:DUF2975 domain-containing protein n=1 Tax=Parastrongyloides trichosuri TaxID=131310 RepID=A0A0N5A4V4_PARTI